MNQVLMGNYGLTKQGSMTFQKLSTFSILSIWSFYMLTQGTNSRKVISEVYAFFVLQCTVFGRKPKTDATAWHGIHFHKNNLWNILVIGNYYAWIIKIIKIKCFYPPRILDEHWCIYYCLQIPPRENWFQYVRRVYTTAMNFPCITSLPSISISF